MTEPMPEAMQLEKCTKCDRKFAADRLEKHYTICKGTKEQDNIQQKPKILERGKYKLENLPSID